MDSELAEMRTRYAFDAESGLLLDRDGNPLGRVVSITLDDKPAGGEGGKGGVGATSTSTSKTEGTTDKQDGGVGETIRPTATQLEREAMQRVWEHWLEVSGKRQQLDDKRERIIRNAVRLVGEEATMTALTGLSRSPHHRGENEQRRPYMEVRYALKGRGDESDDERIEKAITWAAQYAPEARDVDPDKVQRWLEDLRYTASQPHHPERDRGNEAYRKLRAAGFTVIKLDKAPWARIER